jgi:hypothetical protein
MSPDPDVVYNRISIWLKIAHRIKRRCTASTCYGHFKEWSPESSSMKVTFLVQGGRSDT